MGSMEGGTEGRDGQLLQLLYGRHSVRDALRNDTGQRGSRRVFGEGNS